jgi:putative ABC transport system ATP-binding protein
VGAGPVIRMEGITKTYHMGRMTVSALCGVSLEVAAGEMSAIMGPSGSGKSTLMNIMGCLDKPSSCDYYIDGERVGGLDDNALAEIRNRKIGFVFQTFNLLGRTTAVRNVEMPLVYAGKPKAMRREMARAALDAVGLSERVFHRPNELSGGQQQRVAIARALVNDPSILLADEPTGNLDSKAGREIIALLERLNRERGITIMLVTHDPDIARHTRRILRVLDGEIVSDESISASATSKTGGTP